MISGQAIGNGQVRFSDMVMPEASRTSQPLLTNVMIGISSLKQKGNEMRKNLVFLLLVALSFSLGHWVSLDTVEPHSEIYCDSFSVSHDFESSSDPCSVESVEDDEFVLDVCVAQFYGEDFKSYITERYIRHRLSGSDVKTAWGKTMEDGIEYATQIINGGEII